MLKIKMIWYFCVKLEKAHALLNITLKLTFMIKIFQITAKLLRL